jgi:triphosphatase
MGQEVELKLEVPPQAIGKLKRTRALGHGNGQAREKELVSVYFDTADNKLHKHGISLRVRHIGDKRVQTVKANEGSAAGFLERGEWEAPIKSDTPDLRALRRTALAGLLTKKLAHALKPVFETRIRRTVHPLERRGSRIELALDQGEVRWGRKSAPINEVELELKRGRPADLFSVERDLAKRVPARLAVRSKADRGYDLLGAQPIAAVRAPKIALAPRMSTGEAFHAIALGCLYHIAANDPAVRAQDAEGVHQMRVGLRRLRAAIAVFFELLDDEETARIKTELKWLTGELGPARDLDVYVTGYLKPLQRTLPDARGLDALEKDLDARRARAFARAQQAVESARYRTLVLDTLAWIEDGRWMTTDDELIAALRRRNATDFARDELARRVQRVSKRASKLARLDACRRHKLRIAIKKLRYASEFFATLFDNRKARKRLRRFELLLKKLQDCLGALNDIAIHQKIADEVVGCHDAGQQLAFAIGLVSGLEQSRIEPLREAAMRAADRFVDLRPFWK